MTRTLLPALTTRLRRLRHSSTSELFNEACSRPEITSQKADETGLGAAFLPLLEDRLFNLLAAFLALRMLVILLFALPAERPERTDSAIRREFEGSQCHSR